MIQRFVCLLAMTTTLAATHARCAAAEERIDLFGLVTAAPLPPGYTVKRQDFPNPNGAGSTLILLTTPANKSRIQVTIEKKKLFGKREKVEAFKSYVNGISAVFTKRGYKTLEIEHPDSTTIDPEKRLDLRMKLQKDKETLYVDADIFFTNQGYTIWSVAYDEPQRDLLKGWLITVLPK